MKRKAAFRAVLLLGFALFLLSLWHCSLNNGSKVVPVHGLILPGQISPSETITVKFYWQGGGWLRHLSQVMYDRHGNSIVLTPMGIEKGTIWPEDIFWAVGSTAIGPLDEGTYFITLAGEAQAVKDTFAVPTQYDDSVCQFKVTVYNGNFTEVQQDCPVQLRIFEPFDTVFVDTTDSSGNAEFLFSCAADSVLYSIFQFVGIWTKSSIPQIITIGPLD